MAARHASELELMRFDDDTPSLRGLLFVRPMLCVVSNQEMGVNMVLAWVLGQRIRNAKLCRLTLPY